MELAKACHCSTTGDAIAQSGYLMGFPEKHNAAFSDLPRFGGVNIVWLQVIPHHQGPCCDFGDPIWVSPASLLDQNAQSYRRKGLAEDQFFTRLFWDADSIESSGLAEYFELDEESPVGLELSAENGGIWRMRRPDASCHLHVAVVVEQGLALQQHITEGAPPSLHLTREQLAIAHCVAEQPIGFVRVAACAGSGKTTMLVEIGKKSAGHAVYVVFNKSMQADANGKFRRSFVDARTWDSLAFEYVRREICGDFAVVDDMLDILDSTTDKQVWEAIVLPFLQSSEVDMADLAPEAKNLINRVKKGKRLDHALLFKMCQLDMVKNNRRFTQPPANLLLCDEFQDLNRAKAAVAEMEAAHATVVVVGDSQQSLYGFCGAFGALEDVKKNKKLVQTFQLSQSFRFNTAIAKLANATQKCRENCAQDDAYSGMELVKCVSKKKPASETEGYFFHHNILRSKSFRRRITGDFTLLCSSNERVFWSAKALRGEPDLGFVFPGEQFASELLRYEIAQKGEVQDKKLGNPQQWKRANKVASQLGTNKVVARSIIDAVKKKVGGKQTVANMV